VSKGRRISLMKKGKFSFNHHIFRDRISFSSIENLSNELFYEIFDYLDGWDLYQAFANLNHHFEQLVHSPFVRLKIKLCHWRTDDQFENNWKQMIDLHREQIFSMDLSIVPSTMDFFSFNHLQSLTLRYLEFNVCMSVLLKLRSLPCLVSLSISMISNSEYLHEIYRIILALPMLKYCKFSADASYINPPLSMATREEYNSIEYLVIDHSCSFDELIILVSYTPQLRQLHVKDSLESMPNIIMMSPTALINLTHLTIFADNFFFDEVELFIKRMNFKLKVFVIRTSNDTSFLHADRWEQLIVQYLPYLDEFCLLYQEFVGEKYLYDPYHGKQNPFLASFWIQRQWYFDIDIDDEYISYSIQSYRYVIEDQS